MPDNTTINTMTGGDTIATDDIAGVKHQRVKISQGADGSATDVSSAAPLNVTLANTGANATAVKVDGSAATQPVSISGNQAVNIAQMNGVTTTMGNGASGTGVQRVTIASDSTGQVALAAGSATIGALTANQSVNNAQISGNTMAVNNGASTSGTQRVTIANDSTGVLATVSTVTTLTGGGVAHDSADSGNPIKMGGRAETATSTATMVADGDRSDFITDVDGTQIVRINFPLGDLLAERTTNTDGASTGSSTFGATASTKNVVTAISLYNSSATPGYIDFRDGTAGSVLWTMGLPAGGGAVLSDASGLFRTSANTALAYDVSAALSTVYISVSGFKSKV